MKKPLIILFFLAALGVGGWIFMRRDAASASEIEYRYAKVEKGELVRSISANGQLVALTTVDVKSKAGGKVVRLAVDEGSIVHQGDLVAVIDPSDTQAIFDQARADLQSSEAKADQARVNAELQVMTSRTSVHDAEISLELARIRLKKAEQQARTQPQLSSSAVLSAQASLNAQQEAMRQLERVTEPQKRNDAASNLRRTKAALDAAQADMRRQEQLLQKGYVSQAAVDQSRSTLEAATASYDSAKQRLQTLEAEVGSDLDAQRARVRQAEAALAEARANSSLDVISQQSLVEARRNVQQAEVALQKSRDERLNVNARKADVRSAQAGTVRNTVSLKNAKVQLDSTTVLAPRSGVVTQKYLEEGTIIPPGTSTFSQGTSLVQISDTTQMYVECAVDEADIAQVRPGQPVRIIVEAYAGRPFEGTVQRVNPAAKTDQNITAIKVRVAVKQSRHEMLRPGMTATCEFLTLTKPDVLIAPMQAIQREGGKSFVKLKGSDPKKPIKREVQVGATGNDGMEIVSGLKAGEELVVAEIDLKQMRETQKRMQDSQQGGGLAGSSAPRGMGGNRGGAGARTGGTAGGGRGGGR